MDSTLREKVAAVIYRRATSDDPTVAIAPTQFTHAELSEVGLLSNPQPTDQETAKAWKELRRLIEEVSPWALDRTSKV